MTSRLRPYHHSHHQTIIRHTSATAAKSTQVQSGLQSAGWWPAVAGFCATIISMQMQEELRNLALWMMIIKSHFLFSLNPTPCQ